MSFEKIKRSSLVLKRSPETEKDYSLKDMEKILKACGYVDSIYLHEEDRGDVRDIYCKLMFGCLTIAFTITATERYFAISKASLKDKHNTHRIIWAANYPSFVLDIAEPEKKIIYDFLSSVTEVL